MANPRSIASIAGHPIHPMLIPFPIAFFVATLLCDIAYVRSGNLSWATASMWLGAGVAMALLAAVAGLIDVLGDQRIRRLYDVWLHAGGNILLVLIQAYSLYARETGGPNAILPTGLVLSAIAVLLMGFTGWMGWKMVYCDHVGVADESGPTSYPESRYPESRRPVP
ncbi:MAG: DUF2231 domain-containing protein [Alphaproteobacteria bacterium]|nr:DUF2231 domain-containing protein [Alphaproteobacteria bacterium]